MKQWRIKLHRASEDNEMYFLEPFTRRQARTDLILTANHKKWSIIVRWNIIELERWQNWYSEDSLAERRKWSRGKVRRFLNYLETVQQIVQQKSKVKSIITIINYDKYQNNSTTDDTTDGHQTAQQTDTNKNDKKKKNEKEYTNLKEISVEEIIEVRNNIKDSQNDKKWRQTRKATPKIKDLRSKTQREYTKEELTIAIENYIKEIRWRNKNIWYAEHRFTLYEFLDNNKWLQKFVNF